MAELNARIIAKASATAGEEPVAGDLEVAELAVNTADGKLFTKHTDNSIVVISGGTGGGGATSLNDLSDVDVSRPIRTLVDFESTDSSLTAPLSGLVGTRQTTTVLNGSYAYEVPAGQAYGDGSKFEGGLSDTQARYDIFSLHIRSENALSTSNRVSLGGNKSVLDSGDGWTLYTRNTGFSFYANDSYQEIGTLPTMVADTWHHVIYVLDWAGDRSSPPAISLWVDGSQAINNVTPTNAYSESEDLDFYLAYSTLSGGDAKYWDDIRILQLDSIDWNMTDASLNMNSAVAWIDAQTTVNPADGQILTWVAANDQWEALDAGSGGGAVDSVNGETGIVSLGIQDMNDYEEIDPTSYPYSGAWANAAGQYTQAANTTIIYFHEIDDNGVNRSAEFDALGPGDLILLNFSGALVEAEISTITRETSPSNRYRIVLTSALANYGAVDCTIAFEFGVSEGSVLQWDATEEKFIPTPLPDASATRALLGIGEYVDDAAAGTGGVSSGAMYYNTTSSDYRLKS